MNVVMTGDGRLVEVQATAERDPFSRDELDALLDLAAAGIDELVAAQQRGRRRAARVKARLASGNPHKLVELRRALPAWELELLDGDAFPPETGSTTPRTRSIKARFGTRRGPAGRMGDRRRLGHRGVRPRRPAGHRLRALGRRRRGAAAEELDGVADRAARLRLRARRDLAGRRRDRGGGDARGLSRPAPGRRGLRLRPDLRSARGVADGGGAGRRLEDHALPSRPCRCALRSRPLGRPEPSRP